jgi:methylated-DNA-[protein]-cysteine S-methyltransferase
MATERTDTLERALRASIPAPTPTEQADRHSRLARAAGDDGVLDVAYTSTASPFGPLLLAATDAGLVRIGFAIEGTDEVLDDLAARLSPRVLEAPGRLDRARRQLDEYFGGRRTRFELPLDWTLMRGFRRDVLTVTYGIAYGETRTYRAVAAEAGNATAVRATGSALGSNPIPIVIPCHRVLRTDGGLGGYRGGLECKVELLAMEARQRTR